MDSRQGELQPEARQLLAQSLATISESPSRSRRTATELLVWRSSRAGLQARTTGYVGIDRLYTHYEDSAHPWKSALHCSSIRVRRSASGCCRLSMSTTLAPIFTSAAGQLSANDNARLFVVSMSPRLSAGESGIQPLLLGNAPIMLTPAA